MNKLSQVLEEKRQVLKESGTGEILRKEDVRVSLNFHHFKTVKYGITYYKIVT